MDAWEEVPEHQEAEELRGLAEEGFQQVFGGEDQQCSSEEEEGTPVAVLIMASELEIMLIRVHQGEDPMAMMMEIYANSDDCTIEDFEELTQGADEDSP